MEIADSFDLGLYGLEEGEDPVVLLRGIYRGKHDIYIYIYIDPRGKLFMNGTDHIVAEIVITLKLKVELVALLHQRLLQVAL